MLSPQLQEIADSTCKTLRMTLAGWSDDHRQMIETSIELAAAQGGRDALAESKQDMLDAWDSQGARKGEKT